MDTPGQHKAGNSWFHFSSVQGAQFTDKEDLGKRRKTPSPGSSVNKGMETFWLQKRFPQAMERAETSLSPALRKGGRGGHSAEGWAEGQLRATAPPQARVPARRAGSCTSAPAPAPATHGQLSHPGPARAPTSVRLPHGRLTGSIFKRRRNLTPPTSPLYPGSTPLQSPSDPSWQESHSRAPQNTSSAAPKETPGTLSHDLRRLSQARRPQA